jgi:hypothetical protein
MSTEQEPLTLEQRKEDQPSEERQEENKSHEQQVLEIEAESANESISVSPKPDQTVVRRSMLVDRRDVRISKPFAIALLNLAFPGLGTVLMGQTKKGAVQLLMGLLLSDLLLIAFMMAWIPVIGWITVLVILGIMNIWSMALKLITCHDGYVIAQKIDRGLPVMQYECGNWFATFGMDLVFDSECMFISENVSNSYEKREEKQEPVFKKFLKKEDMSPRQENHDITISENHEKEQKTV